MSLLGIGLRALFVYVVILILLRVSGKRAVSQGTTFDFVLALVLGDLFDDVIWAEVSAAQFVVASGALFLTHLAVSMGCYASDAFSRVVAGEARMFLRAGGLLQPALREEQMNEREAEMLLRHKGGLERRRWVEVESAWVELDGRPGILKRGWAQAPQKPDAARLDERTP
jgi:uncharacterized membrane protein YcaP (DUF421 family)